MSKRKPGFLIWNSLRTNKIVWLCLPEIHVLGFCQIKTEIQHVGPLIVVRMKENTRLVNSP